MKKRTVDKIGMGALLAFLLMLSPARLQAQAFIPEEGQALITIAYAYSDAKYTFFSRDLIISGVNLGQKVEEPPTQAHSAYISIEYGVSSKLALSASIPAIFSRYTGNEPHSPIDNGDYHGGFQDFRFGVRYMAIIDPLVVTPFISVVIPSRDYKTEGHSAIGIHYKELHFGLYLAKQLTFISDNLYTEAGYDFAYVEEYQGIRTNRSVVDLTLGYFVTPSITVSSTMSYQKGHAGVDFLDAPPTSVEGYEHDRRAKVKYLALGGSVSVEANDALSFFVSYTSMVSGENTHALRSIAVGSTWSLWPF